MAWVLRQMRRHRALRVMLVLAMLVLVGRSARADLSLDLSASTLIPFAFDRVDLEVRVTNSGTTAASGTIASVALGDGLVFASSDDSRFDSSTQLWTIGTISPGATELLNISVAVLDTGDHSVAAEIDAAIITDPDSTPGNAATTPGEDDDSSLNLLTRAQLTGVIPASSCSTQVSEFDWASTNWPGGFLGPDTFVGDRTRFTVSFSGDVDRFQSAYPRIHSLSTFGDPTTISTMYLFMDYDTIDEQVSMTIDFSHPISEFNWRMFDVDKGVGSWTDEVTITGSINGQTIIPILVPASDAVAVDGNVATGRQNIDNEQGDANVSMYFGAPVDKITVSYAPGFDSPVVPQQQLIAFDVISYCRPEVNRADLSLSASISDAQIFLDETADLVWTITNDGEESARGVESDLALPEGVTVVATSGVGVFDAVTGRWTIDGIIDTGETRSITLTVEPDREAQFTSIGEIAASDAFDDDSIPSNRLSNPAEDDTATVTFSVSDPGADVIEDAPALCAIVGGAQGSNILALAESGTFGAGSGAENEVLSANVFSGIGTGAVYRNQLSDLDSGGFSIAANIRDAFASVHTPIFNQQDGTSGLMLLASGRTADTFTVMDTSLQFPAGSEFIEISLLAQNLADPDLGNNRTVSLTIEVDGEVVYVSPVIAATQDPVWRRMGGTIPADPAGGTRNVRVTAQGPEGAFDIAVDSLVIRDCDIEGAAASGTLYRQIVDDGQFNVGTEPGLTQPVDVTLTPTLTDGSQLSAQTGTTDGEGFYVFSGLLPAIDYQIAVDLADPDLPSGATLATQTPLTVSSLTAGQTRTSNDFGFAVDAVDLALSVSFADDSVVPGDISELAITVTNEGDTTADAILVDAALPSGLSFVSDDSNGDYDTTTGVWTVGTLEPGTQVTLNIDATRLDAEAVTAFAGISSVASEDVDSTPNNGAENEDDSDSDELVAGRSGAIADTRSCLVPVPLIDWARSGLQTGSTSSQAIANAAVGASISYSGNLGMFTNDTPKVGFDFPSGELANEQKLVLFFDDDGSDQTITMSVNFDTPVDNLRFVISDIDSRGLNGGTDAGYRDQVLVRAFGSGDQPLDLLLASGPSVAIIGSSATGTADVSNTSSDGNLTVYVSGEATRLEIDYRPVADFRPDPINQAIAVGDIDYCESDTAASSIQLSPDHERQVQAGSFVTYAHSLTVGDDIVGSALSFDVQSSNDLSWTLYQDVDADQELGPDDVIWTNGASLAESSEEFIAVAFVPERAEEGWIEQTIITASLAVDNVVETASVTDVTRTLSDGAHVRGLKSVAIDADCDGFLTDETASDASFETGKTVPPGACAFFRISYANEGTTPVTEVSVRDPIPSFTSFLDGSASFDVIPDGMTADGVLVEADPVEIVFSLTGSLNPGGQGAVIYGVRVDP